MRRSDQNVPNIQFPMDECTAYKRVYRRNCRRFRRREDPCIDSSQDDDRIDRAHLASQMAASFLLGRVATVIPLPALLLAVEVAADDQADSNQDAGRNPAINMPLMDVLVDTP